MEHRVSVFFYGSFINLDVLAEVDLHPPELAVVKLCGWDIVIEPLATLTPAEDGEVYGIVAFCTHAELERLYGQDWVGTYLPQAVLVEDAAGNQVPALTYIKWEYEHSPAASDYVERIAKPAEGYNFPDVYIEKIRSFAPAG